MKASTRILALLFSSLLASCGGDGGGSSSNEKNLSSPSSLTKLYQRIQRELIKDEFESTDEYNHRINEFTLSLTGYHATNIVKTRYDADHQELLVYGLSSLISDGEYKPREELYRGYTRLDIKNLSDMYTGECSTSDELCESKRYRILSLSPEEAKRIADGFRVDYTLSFTVDQVIAAKYNCISANYTNCAHYLTANVDTIRVYNIIDGQEY